MPEISAITLPSGTTYTLKDSTARAASVGGLSLLGVTTTALTDGATTNPITISGTSVTAVNGNIAIYQNKEFVWVDTDSQWHEFGDTTGLGDLALKDSASGTYTPAGTVSQPTFSGTQATIKPKVTAAGSVAISTGSGTANYTPAGTVSQPTFSGSETTSTGSFTPAGNVTISKAATGTANYTPEGTVSQPTTTVTLNTATKYVAASATGGGSVTAGSAASCTLPVLTTSVTNETLTLGWSAGSFTANTPTAVTLPSFSSQTIATGVQSASTTQPTFTGTGAVLTGTFSGTAGSVSVKGTPSGTVSQPTFSGPGVDLEATFTGTEVEGSATYTPAGSVSQPTFSGTQATITVS